MKLQKIHLGEFSWQIGLGIALLLCPTMLFADAAPQDDFRERIAVPQERAVTQQPIRHHDSGWGSRLSVGVTEAFYDEEDTSTFAAGHLDVWKKGVPINYRVGVEGTHLNLDQENAAPIAEAPGKTPEITFIRIPFSIEYIAKVNDRSRFFIGGGPDIIHTANDLSETDVGMHLGIRYGYDLNEHWGVSVEGGYWWGDVDSGVNDIELDAAYVTPQVNYTF